MFPSRVFPISQVRIKSKRQQKWTLHPPTWMSLPEDQAHMERSEPPYQHSEDTVAWHLCTQVGSTPLLVWQLS